MRCLISTLSKSRVAQAVVSRKIDHAQVGIEQGGDMFHRRFVGQCGEDHIGMLRDGIRIDRLAGEIAASCERSRKFIRNIR